jgi:nucleoid-associated protein YgaU
MLGMDANMPPQTVQLVVSELANEQDPAKLQALAAQLAPQYPIAAGLLNTRANVLLAMQPPATIVPSPSPTPTTVASTYTVQQDDYPWKIAAHFTGHGARWPELVAANPQKTKGKDGNFASLLPGEKLALPSSWTPPQNGAAGAVATTNGANGSGVPMIAPPVIHGPEVPAPSPSSALDPGIPANVASSVLAAVKTGTDPAQLRGFASALSKEGFPIAAALLNAKANMLNPTPPVSPAPTATPPAATPGATPASASSLATYRVKSGDSPSKIAHALIHDGNRWPELVAANPQKKRAKDGNFASLQPGEVLQLPASWASAAPSAAHLPQGGA